MFSVTFRRLFRRGLSVKTSRRNRKNHLNLDYLEARDVPAAGLGVANDFNAFILHDLNAYQSDVQGRVAVGGNATFTAYGLGDQLVDSDGMRNDLIVGGNLTFTNGQVFFGNVVYGGTGTFDQFGHPNGSVRQGTTIDFAAAGAALQSLADGYAALAQTGAVQNRFGTIVLTGNNAGQNIFNVPASMLWNAFDLIINTPAGSTAIVNVTGTEARMQFMGFHINGVSKENVILNFPQATNVTFQGIGIFANVLAPRAHVEFSNGQLNGTMVADSWNGQGQINFNPSFQPPFDQPCTCPPPPPSQVSGMVYFDQNKDGLPQDTEMRFAGVTVTLSGQDSDGNAVSKTATTDAGGIYIFTELPAGTFTIHAETPDGYTPGPSLAGAFGGTTAPNEISAIAIPAGQSSGGYNFAEIVPEPPPPPSGPMPSDISGMVYFDENRDGQPGDLEMRFPAVTVTLTGQDGSGNPVLLTTQTDYGGIYRFAGLAGGVYSIEVTTPAGFVAGPSSVGVFGGTTSPNLISQITIPRGQGSGGYNFAEVRLDPPPPPFVPPSEISGMVYVDVNHDGQPQDNEPRLQGVTMTLTGPVVIGGNNATQTATTDAGGIYVFSGLVAGTYSIDAATPAGYIPGPSSVGMFGGEPHPSIITLISIPQGQGSGGYNFAELLLEQPPPPPEPPPTCPPLPPSQVSGLVYFDMNKDGQPQDNETRFQGVFVVLSGHDLDGNLVSRSTTTDAGGIYAFSGLLAGTYAIQATPPSGYMPGQASTGAFGGTAQSNQISAISIPAGQSSGGYNFAEVVCDVSPMPPSQLSGMVYFDPNHDGVPQDSEQRFAGVELGLGGIDVTGAQVVRTTTTDAGGIFVFSNLPAGTYSIYSNYPGPGYRLGSLRVGAFGGQGAPKTNIFNIVIPAGQSSGGYNFGFIRDCDPMCPTNGA
jgi:choice-of-anchor A domain-containing protein